MNKKSNTLNAIRPDRRTNAELRKVFPEVVKCVAPFFGPEAARLGGSLEYWAARAIQEHHPELDAHEVRTLLNAAMRVHQSGEPYADA